MKSRALAIGAWFVLCGGGLMGQALNDGEGLSHGGRLSGLCVVRPDQRGREEQEVRAVADGAAVLQNAIDGDAQFVRCGHGLLFLPCDPDGPQEFGIVDGRDRSALRRRGWLQSPAAAQAEAVALALADRELHGITLSAWTGEGSGDPFAADGEASHGSGDPLPAGYRNKRYRHLSQPVVHGGPQGIEYATQLLQAVVPPRAARLDSLRDCVPVSLSGDPDARADALDAELLGRSADRWSREFVPDIILASNPLFQQGFCQRVVGESTGDDHMVKVAGRCPVHEASHLLPSVVGRLCRGDDCPGARSVEAVSSLATVAHQLLRKRGRHGGQQLGDIWSAEQLAERLGVHGAVCEQQRVGHNIEVGAHLSASVVGRQRGGDQRSQDHQPADDGTVELIEAVPYGGIDDADQLAQFGTSDDGAIGANGSSHAASLRFAFSGHLQDERMGPKRSESGDIHGSDSTTSAPSETPAPPRFLPSAWYLVDLDSRRLQEGADVGTVVRMLTLRSNVRGYEHVMGFLMGVRSLGMGWVWRSRDGSFFVGAGAVVETASLFDPDRPLEVRPAVTISMRRGDEQ